MNVFVRDESWASPSQPRRSRCGQSVGMDWKFDIAAMRVMCCTASRLGSEKEISPVRSYIVLRKWAVTVSKVGTPGYPVSCT